MSTRPTAATASSNGASTAQVVIRAVNLWKSYDQGAITVLRGVDLEAVAGQTIALCGPSGCFPVSDHVTVNHHMSATVPVSLLLKSTSLDLSKRTPAGQIGNGQTSTGGSGGTSGAQTLPSARFLWVYAGLGLVGVGVVGTLAWLLRRRARIGAPIVQPGPLPAPSPPVTMV